MNRGYPVVALVLSLCLLASLPTASAARKEAPVKPDFKALDVKAWDNAVYKLAPPPTGSGNAAAFILEAIHFGFVGPNEVDSKIPYAWWKTFKPDDLDGDEPEKKALRAEAVKIPELDLLVKGSQQSEYRWVGIYSSPSPDASEMYISMRTPRYIDIMWLTSILIARAEDKVANGDKAGAEADMMAALRVGHVMQQDVVELGYFIGIAIELRTAKKIPAFYRKMGDEAKAKAWDDFLPIIEKHRDDAKAALKYFGEDPPLEELIGIADDPSLPRSMRLLSLSSAMVAGMLSNPAKIAIGVSDKAKKVITSKHFDDPEMVVIQLKFIEDAYAGQLSGAIGRMKLRGMAKALK